MKTIRTALLSSLLFASLVFSVNISARAADSKTKSETHEFITSAVPIDKLYHMAWSAMSAVVDDPFDYKETERRRQNSLARFDGVKVLLDHNSTPSSYIRDRYSDITVKQRLYPFLYNSENTYFENQDNNSMLAPGNRFLSLITGYSRKSGNGFTVSGERCNEVYELSGYKIRTPASGTSNILFPTTPKSNFGDVKPFSEALMGFHIYLPIDAARKLSGNLVTIVTLSKIYSVEKEVDRLHYEKFEGHRCYLARDQRIINASLLNVEVFDKNTGKTVISFR